MVYNLFLDDVREPSEAYNYTKISDLINLEWVVVKNYNEFINYISSNGLPNIVSFDHDLACVKEYEETGKDCADWLINYCVDNNLEFPKYWVHSANPIGVKRIDSVINTYFKCKDLGII